VVITVRVRGVGATLRPGRIEIDGVGDARDLEALARALWAARTREVLRRAGLTREPAPIGRRAEEYVRRRAQIVACGQSRDGKVRIRARGMRDWSVTGDITAERVQEAAEALIADQQGKVRALKRAIWAAVPWPRPR
jgi:hypothetical protein